MEFTPKKLYYKIREVSRIVGVPSHVLRYWEGEFPMLSPPKNTGGQRTYRPKDIELLLTIRQLLYEDGYTIAGARKRLSSREPTETPADRPSPRRKRGSYRKGGGAASDLHRVRMELENILTLLERE